MSSVLTDATSEQQQGQSFYAALARTTARGATLYFSRPVRLFRPSKVSGWHSLRGLAIKHGTTLNPQYLTSLVRAQGLWLLPKHFVPPMLVNAALGTVLWTTYSATSGVLEPHLSSHPIILASICGAISGGVQALVAAPAENARAIIEGGTSESWSHAWKELFRGAGSSVVSSNSQRNIQEIRQVRNWMKEVSEMAGRGWDGWKWGCAKDTCSFAVFFTIFELTRAAALRTKAAVQELIRAFPPSGEDAYYQRHVPRTVHGLTLVSGGVMAGLAYEAVSRPWDEARRIVQLERKLHGSRGLSAIYALTREVREQGIFVLFRSYTSSMSSGEMSTTRRRRRLEASLRTLARVGPWGIGFLVWEAFGPGI